jgi:hypothetical protein
MTNKDRRELLEEITLMVLEDFGEADDNAPFNPFAPADVARQAVIMIQAVYEDFIHADEAADDILSRYRADDIDIENVIEPV